MTAKAAPTPSQAHTQAQLPCPFCWEMGVSECETPTTFEFGEWLPVTLEVVEPVMTCSHCGGKFTDYRSEDRRAAAIAKHAQDVKAMGSIPAQKPVERAERFSGELVLNVMARLKAKRQEAAGSLGEVAPSSALAIDFAGIERAI